MKVPGTEDMFTVVAAADYAAMAACGYQQKTVDDVMAERMAAFEKFDLGIQALRHTIKYSVGRVQADPSLKASGIIKL